MLKRNASTPTSIQPAGTDWAAHEFARAPLPGPASGRALDHYGH